MRGLQNIPGKWSLKNKLSAKNFEIHANEGLPKVHENAYYAKILYELMFSFTPTF